MADDKSKILVVEDERTLVETLEYSLRRQGYEVYTATDGRLALGYNLLGSYAAEWARQHPDVGLILPRDFTVVVSRVGLVPQAARAPDLGTAFLAYMMSPGGQRLLSETLRLSAVSLEVAGQTSPAGGMQHLAGLRLKPVPVSPGLLAYLDQATRAKLLARWNRAIHGK